MTSTHYNIAIINESTAVPDAEVKNMVPALQTQVTQHFAPIWDKDAHLAFVPKGQKADPTYWQLAILDDSDQADALGYHELTDLGQPVGKVFAATDKQYGLSVSVTTSHELLEMIADPWTNYIHKVANGDITIVEVCDAVEEDNLGYQINGVQVSDFVLPAYYGYHHVLPHQYDWMKHLNAAFPALTPGGYVSVYSNGNWTQITAELAPGVKSYRSDHSKRVSIIEGKQPLRRA